MNYVSDNYKAANALGLGCWHVPDPANQHASLYVGMGNNSGISISGNPWKGGGGNGGHRDGGGTTFHRPVKQPPRKKTPAELAAIAKGKELRAKLDNFKNQYEQCLSAKRAAEKRVNQSDAKFRNQYGKTPISLAQFRAEYIGCKENEIIIGKSSKFGYKFPNKISGKGSFVTLSNGREVDMTHFFVVGRRGYLMGSVNELTQIGTKSFFYPQDLYSNELGISFFDRYSTAIDKNPTKISEYIYWFLSNPSNISLP